MKMTMVIMMLGNCLESRGLTWRSSSKKVTMDIVYFRCKKLGCSTLQSKKWVKNLLRSLQSNRLVEGGSNPCSPHYMVSALTSHLPCPTIGLPCPTVSDSRHYEIVLRDRQASYSVSSWIRFVSMGASPPAPPPGCALAPWRRALVGRLGGGDSVGFGWVRVNGNSTERSLRINKEPRQ